MKICPKCNKEFEDNLDFCTDDYTELKSVESVESVEVTSEMADSAATTDVMSAEDEPLEEVSNDDNVREFKTDTVKTTAAVASQSGGGLSATAKGLLVLAIIMLVGGGLVFWKAKYGGHSGEGLTQITAQDMQYLLEGANPMMLKRLAEDPELKKQQAESLKQLLAVASQARKDGIADEPAMRAELANIETEILALNYDQFINKDKGPMPQFGYIGEDRVKAFWEEDGNREAEFQKFLNSKLELMKASNPAMADRQPSEEEITQIKEYFAKTRIYAKEAQEKLSSGELNEEFKRKLELQTKLQQAQLLARTYAQKTLVERTKVTDEEVDKYIAEHPEMDPAAKKTKAEEILKRAQGGEDFAKLANEFSEDPGNKPPDKEPQGGLYADVTKGKMVPEFEAAALALEPGQIAPNLVETQFGYHIIKLDRKGETKDDKGQASETYDVRHILISTAVKDPENPMGREMPVKDLVRQKLEKEKSEKVLEEIVASNPVEVAVDYEVPAVSDEELQKMMQQQQMQQPGGPQGPPPGAPQGAPPQGAPPAGAKPPVPPKTAPKAAPKN